MVPLTFVVLAAVAAPATAYLWPSPQLDALENLRFDQTGFNPNNIIFFVNPCNQFSFGEDVGRSNAADWIRTAYHDMATHNKTAGTGGLDASIGFETSRPENAGTSFTNTLQVVQDLANRYVSVADTIALGALLAYEQCGGPAISFQGGRVDAHKADAPGVPQPQQSLASHTAAFARQGFNATEMIGLIACGHTFGGVQHSAFPTIVPASAVTNENADGQSTFDTTPTTFDNVLAKQYIAGTTKDPLVVGHNVTTRSDARIFGSDHNRTMAAFAQSSSHFSATCANLISRMLSTVPRDVTLTEVINPLPAKPHNIQLQFIPGANKIFAFGQVRFVNQNANSPPKATIHWEPRAGGKSISTSLVHDSDMIGASPHTGQHVWYQFGKTSPTTGAGEGFSFSATSGIKNFWFTLSNGQTFDQDRHTFPIQDTVMLANGSCIDINQQSNPASVLIAVRKAAGTPSRVWIESDTLTFNEINARVNITEFTAKAVHPQTPSSDPYALYSVTFGSTDDVFELGGVVVKATIYGKTYETLRIQLVGTQLLPFCPFVPPTGPTSSIITTTISGPIPTVPPSNVTSGLPITPIPSTTVTASVTTIT